MFENFANVWTPLILAREIRNRPVAIYLAGEKIVLFRNGAGEIGALLDRCPHRGASLSLGQVTAAGNLECPFHGWQFDRAGANCRVPLNPDAKLPLLGTKALPVRLLGEMVWVFTSVDRAPTQEPQPPEGMVAPIYARTYVQRLWSCHWTRAMENMFDSPHLPFVHRRTIGKPLRRRMTPNSRMEISWEDTPWGGRTEARLDAQPGGAWLEFYRPNVMALIIPVPKKHLRIHAMVIPERAGHTRLIICQSRDFARSVLFEPIFSWMNRRIADEDKAVVESSGGDEVPPPGSECSVATDRATLQFRKYYYESLRHPGTA